MADENKVGTRGSIPMNLQLFAGSTDDEKDDDTDGIGTDGKDGKDNQGGDNDQTAGASGDAKKSDKTFTQAQVSQMMAKEKKQGRAAALRELGIDPNDKKAVKMVQALFASQKDDDNGASDETATKVAEAEAKAARAECKAEAMVLGAKAEYVEDVIVLAMAKMDEDSDFKTIIGEIKTKYPMFFGIETNADDKDDKGKDDKDTKGATGKKGTGASMKNFGKDDKGKDKEEKSLGSRLAAQRSGAQRKGTNFIKR